MITPSATELASTACSGVDKPTPSSTGLSVAALSRRPISNAPSDSFARSPVTPRSDTP